MILPGLLLTLLARQFQPAKTWYGPQEVSFFIQFAGNPYDPEVNEVKVHFVNDNGLAVDRPAYFEHGAWRALLMAPLPGHYRATLIHNGKNSTEEAVPKIIVLDQKAVHGFVHLDKLNSNRLIYDDGSAIYPFGFNLGWQEPNLKPMADEIKKMGSAGLTWTRIWADNWDGKNPWWPTGDPFAIPDQLWPKALDHWEQVISSCDGADMDYQMVLFHSSAFKSGPGGEWEKNPWNVQNGGFLKSADEFFRDPEAKRRTKIWLRFAVSRWSGDPHLFAFELFDDAEQTDAALHGHWSDIVSWHQEMAIFIRSLDPYGHLITTSSDLSQKNLWDSADFYQPHLSSDTLPTNYPAPAFPDDKPGFPAEFGPDIDQGDHERAFINTVIWQSLRQNRAAAAMYWHWDRVESKNLLPQFQVWAQILTQSNLAQHPQATPAAITTSIGVSDGLRDVNWILLRLRGADGKMPKLSWAGMIDLTWKATITNVLTGETYSDIFRPAGASVQIGKVRGNDVVISLQVSD